LHEGSGLLSVNGSVVATSLRVGGVLVEPPRRWRGRGVS
jgi:hypothetical protein